MAVKKILGISIILLTVIAAVMIVLNSGNSYYLIDQDGETRFEMGDTIYAQLDKPELIIASIDGGEAFLPDYEREDKAILAYDLSTGTHTLVIQLGKETLEHTITVEEGLNIPSLEVETFIPYGAQRSVEVTAAGFTTQQVEDGSAHWVTLDLEILEGSEVIVRYADAAESVGPASYKTTLTAPIDTTGLELKSYTLRATLSDEIAGEERSKEVMFVVT